MEFVQMNITTQLQLYNIFVGRYVCIPTSILCDIDSRSVKYAFMIDYILKVTNILSWLYLVKS